MRFIANLGCSTTVVFPGAKPPARCARLGALAGVKRPRRLPPVKLCFRPVNFFLQNIYQVCGGGVVVVASRAAMCGDWDGCSRHCSLWGAGWKGPGGRRFGTGG